MNASECNTELIEKKKPVSPVSIMLLAVIFVAVIMLIFAIVTNKSNEKPVSFTDVGWDATQDEVLDEHGTPDDEYDNDTYGHIVVYYGVEYEGYIGQAKFCFRDDKLHTILFYIDEYDIETVKYFNELYESQYGEIDFENGAGTLWYDEKANYGISSSPLVGGFINCLFSKPTQEATTDASGFPWWIIVVAAVVVGVVVTYTVTRKTRVTILTDND